MVISRLDLREFGKAYWQKEGTHLEVIRGNFALLTSLTGLTYFVALGKKGCILV